MFKQLLPSILIALVLLLSGVSSGIAIGQNASTSNAETSQIKKSRPQPTPRAPDQSEIPWRKIGADIGDVANVLSTIIIAIFTYLLWKVSHQQAVLIFEQWIDLEWTCAEKEHGDQLRVCVNLVNPTKFPITFSGDLTVGHVKRCYEDEPLPPGGPKSEYFDISVAGDEFGAVYSEVTAHFCHLHRVGRRPVFADWNGELKCEWWGHQKKWHATFTRFPTHTRP